MKCSHNLGHVSSPRTCGCGIEVHRIEDVWYPVPGIHNGRLVEISHNGVIPLFESNEQIIRTRYHILHNIASEWMSSPLPMNTSNKLKIQDFEKLTSIYSAFGCMVSRIDVETDLTYDLAVLVSYRSNTPQLPYFGTNIQEPLNIVKIEENITHLGITRILEYSNHSKLKLEQEHCINSVLSNTGSATIAALPTGFGKTLISQACSLALREKGPTLVISPLISLIDDQEESYLKLNNRIRSKSGTELKIEFLRSTEPYDLDDINYKLLSGSIDVLCCSPETLVMKQGTGLMETIRRLGLTELGKMFSLFVIDEAHIVSDWGVTIRPHFIMLKSIIKQLVRLNSELRLLFLSATISDKEEDFIKQYLCPMEAESVNTIRIAEIRKDIAFNLIKFPPEEELDELVKQAALWDINSPFHSIDKAPFLIYTRSPADAERFKVKLDQFGKVGTYTGETPSRTRGKLRDHFVSNKVNGIVGTSAFGMGIDKPDLQCITYIGRPYSVKDLYQAFGRVARNSNWEGVAKGKRVCGNAIGILSELSRASPFRPELGSEKMLERLWDLLSNSIRLSNGIIAVQSSPIPAFWEPLNESINEVLIVDEDQENPANDHNLPEHVIAQMRKRKQNERSVHFQNWVISVFSLCGYWELEGVWSSSCIGIDTSGVMDQQRSISELWQMNRSKPNKSYSVEGETYLLLAVKKEISSFDELRQACKTVLQELKKMHADGAKGIQSFITDEGCIRARFGPAIGLSEKENLTCIEINEKAVQSDDILATPCAVCRPNYDLDSFVNDACLWVDYPSLKHTIEQKKLAKVPTGFDSNWEKLPHGAIDVCRWEKGHDGSYQVVLSKHTNPGLSQLYLHKPPIEILNVDFFEDIGIQVNIQLNSKGGVIKYIADRLVMDFEYDLDYLTTIVWHHNEKLILRVLPNDLHAMENTRLKIKRVDPDLALKIQKAMPHGHY